MEICDTINKRVSVRSYKDRPLDFDTINIIAQSGQNAPCAGEFSITVVQNKEILNELSDIVKKSVMEDGIDFMKSRLMLEGYEPLHNAPSVIFFSSKSNDKLAHINTAMAAENIILTATTYGLGSCFIYNVVIASSGKYQKRFKELLQLDQDMSIYCAVALGEIEDENKYSLHNIRKPVSLNYIN